MLAGLAQPHDISTLLPNHELLGSGPIVTSAFACDILVLGTAQGALVAIALPALGEHSLNSSLPLPEARAWGTLPAHGAKVSALTVIQTPQNDPQVPLEQGAVTIYLVSACVLGVVVLSRLEFGAGIKFVVLADFAMAEDPSRPICLLKGNWTQHFDPSAEFEGEDGSRRSCAEEAQGRWDTADGTFSSAGLPRPLLVCMGTKGDTLHSWLLTEHPATCGRYPDQ
jgi:hypothetical protein